MNHHSTRALVQKILTAMHSVIEKFELELMLNFPDDLLVHDRNILKRIAVPGAKIAWMVGHTHTHMVALGFISEENINVEYLTNLCNDDRFFLISVGRNDSFKMEEVSRTEFAKLSNTAVRYENVGSTESFWLQSRSQQIGHVELKSVGDLRQNKIAASITPMSGISGHELVALEVACSHAITKSAQSLAVQYEVTWAEPIALALAA